MINGIASTSRPDEEALLAHIAELIVSAIQAGIAVDIECLVGRYPDLADAIRGIHSTLIDLNDGLLQVSPTGVRS